MNLKEMSLVIVQAMRDRKINQVELGKELGIADRTVRKWISGKCRTEQYLDLCMVLGLSVKVVGGTAQVLEISGDFVVVNKTGKVHGGEGEVVTKKMINDYFGMKK